MAPALDSAGRLEIADSLGGSYNRVPAYWSRAGDVLAPSGTVVPLGPGWVPLYLGAKAGYENKTAGRIDLLGASICPIQEM